jgi:ATP-dependent Lon protease
MLCTGLLNDTMLESARVARTLAGQHAGLLKKDIIGQGIHLHIPEGAVHKDGPSAGVAITVALASLFKNEPVKEKIAFTGEITLRGSVLRVGGIKQKIIGAKKAGIKEVVIPFGNQRDFDDIHPDFKAGLKVYFVKNIEEVFDIAFAKKERKERKKR